MEDGRLRRAPKEARNSRPASCYRHSSLSLQSVAVRGLQFPAIWQNYSTKIALEPLRGSVYRAHCIVTSLQVHEIMDGLHRYAWAS